LPRRPRLSDFLSPHLLLSATLCLSLPLAIAFGPVSWYLLKDPLLQRLHQTYIVEFLHGNPSPSTLLATYRLPSIAILATPIVILFQKRLGLSVHIRSVLCSSLLLTLVFLATATWQRRWGFLLGTSLYTLATILCLALLETRPHRFFGLSTVSVFLVVALSLADATYAIHCRLRLESGIAHASAIPDEWIHNDMYKRMTLRLATQMGTNRWAVAGIPAETPSFYYYASIPSLASFYWENATGWHAETAIMGDTSPSFGTALSVARARGITHFISGLASDSPLKFLHIGTGVSNQFYAASRTFCGHITHTQLFERLPSVLLDDFALNSAVTQPVLFRTPAGYAQETSQLHIFTFPSSPSGQQ
ncbi:MAG: hypothetical protein J6Y19_03805, partial [Kiritimatiellae bacterium]|nr:hypothetical protein [Kiritimatiellia bacterium]